MNAEERKLWVAVYASAAGGTSRGGEEHRLGSYDNGANFQVKRAEMALETDRLCSDLADRAVKSFRQRVQTAKVMRLFPKETVKGRRRA